MKKFRKLSFVIAVVLCLSMLAACSSGNEAPAGDSTGSQDDVSSDTPSTAGNEAGEEVDTSGLSGTVKVGILAPLTGEVAQYGIAVSNGAKMYIEEYNARGGLQIEYAEYDEEGDPSKAITGYNSLVDQGIVGLIGDVTTAPTLAVVPEAFEDNMPMITASATAAAVTVNEETGEVFTNMFRSCFIDPFQGEKMAAFAVDNVNASTAAILYNTGSDYSIGLMESFVEKAGELNLEIVSTEGYADGAVDFQSQLTNIAATNPDVLFLPDYYETIALISQQAQSAGVDATMLGVDGWDTVLSVASPEAIEGSYYCSGYSTEDETPAVQEFLSAYMDKYGAEPNMFSAQGYDAAMILIAAIEQAEGQGLEAGTDEYSAAVIAAMKATDMDCVTGHVTYNQYNNPEKTAVIINITGGEAKFWGKY